MLTLLVTSGAKAQGRNSVSVRVPLGAAARYGLLSGGALTANTPVWASGNAGGITVSASVRATDSVVVGGSRLTRALADLQTARSYVAGLTGQAVSGNLGGQTLGEGVYAVSGAATCAVGAKFILSGDSASVVVLRIGSNLAFEAGSSLVLNGVLPEHVYWSVEGVTRFATESGFCGILLGRGTVSCSAAPTGYSALLTASAVSLTDAVSGYPYTPPFRSVFQLQHSLRQSTVTCSYVPQAFNLVDDGSFECPTDGICPTVSNQGSPIDYWKSQVY